MTTTLVAALWAAPLHAQTVNLTRGQAIGIAAQSLRDGNPDQAAFLADTLLKRFPNDASALLLRTQAAVSQQDYADATRFGRRAFWHADSEIQRFNAARFTALGHARQGQDNLAQVWLRLARQFAPDDRAADQVAQDFREVRRRNPLSVNLRFGITPSSNVNSGSANDESGLFGSVDSLGNPISFILSEDAQALAGWEYSGSLNLRYRIRTDRSSATFFDFGLSGQTYTLTDSAKDRAEAANPEDPTRGSDFANTSLSFGVAHRFVIAPDAGLTEASVSYTQTWRAGDRNRRYLTTSLSHTWTFDGGDTFRLAGFSQQQERDETGDRAQVFDLAGTYRKSFDNIGRVGLTVGVRDNAAEDNNEDYDAVRYALDFSPEDPLFGVNFGFNLSYEERDFDQVDLAGGPRNDEITSLSLRAVISDVEFFGFQPVLTASRTHQDSSLPIFERKFNKIGFDIVSSF